MKNNSKVGPCKSTLRFVKWHTNFYKPLYLRADGARGDEIPCTFCAFLVWEGIPYPTSRWRYVDVSVYGRTLWSLVSTLEECHIPRVTTSHFREPCTCECSLVKIHFIIICNYALAAPPALLFVSLQSLGTNQTLHPLFTLQNNELVPQVLKQVVNLLLYVS